MDALEATVASLTQQVLFLEDQLAFLHQVVIRTPVLANDQS
jgi:hypothetical protein